MAHVPDIVEKMVDVFERKILRRIQDRDQWRCRFNKELYDLFKEPRLSVVILQGCGRLVMLQEWMRTIPRRLMCLGRTKKSGKTACQIER
jgi:hypothetical protein